MKQYFTLAHWCHGKVQAQFLLDFLVFQENVNTFRYIHGIFAFLNVAQAMSNISRAEFHLHAFIMCYFSRASHTVVDLHCLSPLLSPVSIVDMAHWLQNPSPLSLEMNLEFFLMGCKQPLPAVQSWWGKKTSQTKET